MSPMQLTTLPESKPSHAHATRVVVLPVMRLEVSNALRFGQPDETIPAAGGKDPRPQPLAMACWCRAAKAGKLAPTVLARAEGCVSEAFHRLEHLLKLLCVSQLLRYAALTVTQLAASAQAMLLYLRLRRLPANDRARAWRKRRLTRFHPGTDLLATHLLHLPVSEHPAGEDEVAF